MFCLKKKKKGKEKEKKERKKGKKMKERKEEEDKNKSEWNKQTNNNKKTTTMKMCPRALWNVYLKKVCLKIAQACLMLPSLTLARLCRSVLLSWVCV